MQNKQQPHVLILGGPDASIDQLPLFGIRVTFFQYADAVTDSQLTQPARLIIIDKHDDDTIVKLATRIHRGDPFSAVLSFSETWLIAAATIGEAFGVQGNPLHPVSITRDKVKMRETLRGSSLDTVRFAVCRELADLEQFFRGINAPFIVKPASGAGSSGVSLAREETDLQSAWLRATEVPPWAKMLGTDVLAEEFIDGPEYSIEAISRKGRHEIIGVTEKVTTGAPHFIELGHQFPARIPDALSKSIHAAVLELLDRVGHVHGPSHSEVRIRDGRVYVIETQTRFGGDQIWELVWLTTGMHFAATTVMDSLGFPRPVYEARARSAAIRFITLPEGKTLAAIDGIDAVTQLPWVVRVKLEVKPGMRTPVMKDSKSRCGYVLTLGDSIEEAVGRAEQAISMLRFSFERVAGEEPDSRNAKSHSRDENMSSSASLKPFSAANEN